ncbi:MAG: calcium-binding protein, partial [Pikeienuella sp.]
VIVFTQFDDLGAGEREIFAIRLDLRGCAGLLVADIPLRVDGANDAPEAGDQSFTVRGGGRLSGAFSAVDADGDALAFSLVGPRPAGNFLLNEDGAFVFNAPNAAGRYGATLRVEDGEGGAAFFDATFDVAQAPRWSAAPFTPGGEVFEGDDGGNDIEAGDGDNIVRARGGDDVVSGRGGRDLILAGDGDDVIYGNAGGDTIQGGRGDDLLIGQRGYDLLRGGAGEDTVNGGGMDDRLFGGGAADIVIGGAGKDSLTGGAGNDRLVGGDDNDRLEGRTGADFMIGGAGRDRFIFGDNFGRDRIADFGQGPDVLNFTRHSTVNSMADLTIRAQGGDTLIEDGAGNRLFLTGVAPRDLDADDFLF